MVINFNLAGLRGGGWKERTGRQRAAAKRFAGTCQVCLRGGARKEKTGRQSMPPSPQSESDQASGTTGCNHSGGNYLINDDSIKIENIDSTELSSLDVPGCVDHESNLVLDELYKKNTLMDTKIHAMIKKLGACWKS